MLIYYDVNVKNIPPMRWHHNLQSTVEKKIPPYWTVASGFQATHLNNRKQKTRSHLSGREKEGTDQGDGKEGNWGGGRSFSWPSSHDCPAGGYFLQPSGQNKQQVTWDQSVALWAKMKLFLNVFMTCQYRHQGRVTEAQTPPCALCGSEYPAQHLKTFITPPPLPISLYLCCSCDPKM